MSEADRLRAAIEKHRHSMREYRGAEFDFELWKALDGTEYDETGGEAGWVVDGLQKMNERLNDLLRWRELSEEAPESPGQYQAFWDKSEGVFVVNYDPFTQAEWKHCIAPPLYWRPIGPLPGGE